MSQTFNRGDDIFTSSRRHLSTPKGVDRGRNDALGGARCSARHLPGHDGKTWKNALGSRSVETSYQNTTNKPITVAVTARASSREIR